MLRSRQKQIILRILNQNKELDTSNSNNSDISWKILIYDKKSINFLSTLFKLGKLMEIGISSIYSIESARDKIPDVLAFYLVEPTKENLDRIAKDCTEVLYDRVSLNFISPCKTDDLKDLAKIMASSPSCSHVEAVFDEYINFASPDPGLFTIFENYSCFSDFYNAKSQDDKIKKSMDDIVDGLVSVILTMGHIPHVIYNENDEVSDFLFNLLSERIKPIAGDFRFWEYRKPDPSSTTPILVLCNRTCDLVTGLHHSDVYQSLIHEIYGIKRNQITIDKTTYDLDTEIDEIWENYRDSDFASVAESLTEKVGSLSKKEENVNIHDRIINFKGEKRKTNSIQNQVTIASSIQTCIADNKKNLAQRCEFSYISRQTPEESLDDVIQNLKFIDDKLRLLIIAYLYDQVKIEQIESYGLFSSDSQSTVQLPNDLTKEKFREILKALNKYKVATDNRFVFSLIGKSSFEEKLPLPSMIKKLMDQNTQGFKFMNLLDKSSLDNPSLILTSNNDFNVFVIGPGTYCEAAALRSIVKEKKVSLTYGCTCIQRPSDFLVDVLNII